MDPATSLGLARLLLAAIRLARRAARTSPLEEAIGRCFDVAVREAIQSELSDYEHWEPTYERLYELVEGGDDIAQWIGGCLEQPSEPCPAAGQVPDDIVLLLTSVRSKFAAQLRADAARPDSPLTNRVLVVNAADAQAGDATEELRSTSTFPAPVAAVLEDLARSEGAAGHHRLLIEALDAPLRQRRSVVSRLIGDPPAFVGSLTGSGWIAMAEYASSYGDHSGASLAYKEVARLRPGEAAEYRTEAALAAIRGSDSSEAEELLAAARVDADESTVAFVEVAEAVNRDDEAALPELCTRALELGVGPPVLLGQMRALASARRGQVSQAIAELTRLVEENPKLAGPRIVLADVLFGRGGEERSTTRDADLYGALDHARTAIDLRRAFGGDSQDAMKIACLAAAELQEWALVLSLVDGALPSELSDATIADAVALAEGAMGLDPTTSDPHQQRFLDACLMVESEETRESGIQDLLQQAETAPADHRLERILRTLADVGVADLPRIDELRTSNAGRADAIQGLASYRHGDREAALDLLRRASTQARVGAFLLSYVQHLEGEDDAAARTLLDGARLFGDTSLAVQAVDVYMNSGRLADASEVCETWVSDAPLNSLSRRAFRRRQLRVAVLRQDIRAIESLATLCIDEGESDPMPWWARTEALLIMGRFDDAWHHLSTDDRAPRPSSEQEAVLAVQAQLRSEPNAADFTFELLERFDLAHELAGAALNLFMMLQVTSDVDDEVRARFHEVIEAFVERYPDSTSFGVRRVADDDPDALLELLAGMDGRSALDPSTQRDHEDAIAAGTIPGALVLGRLGRIFTDWCDPPFVPFPAVPADGEELRLEIEAARAAIGGPLVVDLTSIAVLARLPAMWEIVRSSFTFPTVARPHMLEVSRTGWLRSATGHVDSSGGSIQFSELPESALERQRWVREELLPTLTVVDLTIDERLGRLREFDEHGEWCGAIEVAAARGAPLLCDDLATRRLGRGESQLEAFGSFALMLALGADEPDVTEFFRAGLVDLPLDTTAQWHALESAGFPVDLATRTLSQASFWADPPRAAQIADRIVANVANLWADRDREAVLRLLASAACRGILRRTAGAAAVELIASSAASIILRATGFVETAPVIVSLMRTTCLSYGAHDPIAAIAGAMNRMLLDQASPAEAARLVMTAFSTLPQDDRTEVARALLAG